LVPIDFFKALNSNFCSRTHHLATIHSVQTTDGRNTVPIARYGRLKTSNALWPVDDFQGPELKENVMGELGALEDSVEQSALL